MKENTQQIVYYYMYIRILHYLFFLLFGFMTVILLPTRNSMLD